MHFVLIDFEHVNKLQHVKTYLHTHLEILTHDIFFMLCNLFYIYYITCHFLCFRSYLSIFQRCYMVVGAGEEGCLGYFS